jgi:hypothetical protein
VYHALCEVDLTPTPVNFTLNNGKGNNSEINNKEGQSNVDSNDNIKH